MQKSRTDGAASVPRPQEEGTVAVPRPEAARGVAVAERSAPAVLRSRYGPLGALAKRIVQRLIRFYTARQDAVNAQLASRLSAIETMLGELPDLRRDITDTAVDFGAIAERMRALENVRRIVERSAAYRNEVRAHRRDLLDLHQHAGALSARLTLVQRETAQTATLVRQVRVEIARLSESSELLAKEQVMLGGAVTARDDRLAEVAQSVDERLAEVAQSAGEARLAAERDLEKLSGTLRETIDGLAREAAENAQRREEALREELEEQIERARSNAWKLQTTFEALVRDTSGAVDIADRLAGAERHLDRIEPFVDRVAAAVERLADAERRIERIETVGDRVNQLEQRDADLAGALNEVQERVISSEYPASLQSLGDAIRTEARAAIAADREQRTDENAVADRAFAAEIAALREQTDTLRAQLEELRDRLFATPYLSAPMSAWPIRRISTPDDFDYVGFEDVFRGPEEFIRERLRRYVPLVEEHAPVVELGAGRGEFMELMREHGIPAAGVDLNAGAVERCREKGIENVVLGDANAYLASLEERSAGTVFSAQFVEHVSFGYLLQFLELARTRLAPGGTFIAETINPNSIEGWKTFFVDLTHVKPLFPEVLVFLCRSMGFVDVRIFYPNGGGFDETSPGSQPEYAVVATAPSEGGSKPGAADSAPSDLPRPPRERRRE